MEIQVLYSQQFKVELNKDEIYEYIDNPVTVSAYGVKCENIFVSVNNGDLKGSGCSYDLAIIDFDSVAIQVFKIVLKDTTFLGEKKYLVAELPNPYVELGGKQGGEIHIEEFKAQKGLVIPEKYHKIMDCSRLEIDQYKIVTILSNNQQFESVNYGSNFNEAFESFKNKLLPGTTGMIFFDDIIATPPDKTQKIELDGVLFYLVK